MLQSTDGSASKGFAIQSPAVSFNLLVAQAIIKKI